MWMFQTNYLGLKMGDPFFEEATFCYLKKGMNSECIREVRDQLVGDTCYAFAATAAMYAESVLKRANGNPLNASCQELMDCLHEPFPPKSLGSKVVTVPPNGLPNSFEHAYEYARILGMYFASDYPYTGIVSSCQETLLGKRGCPSQCSPPSDRKIFVGSHSRCRRNSVIKQLERQPLVGKILLNREFTRLKGDGIFPGASKEEEIEYKTALENKKKRLEDKARKEKEIGPSKEEEIEYKTVPENKKKRREDETRKEKETDPNYPSFQPRYHAVLIIGHDVKDEIPYFICQNSYGVEWGHEGYFKIPQEKVSQIWYPSDVKFRVPSEKRKRKMAKKIEKIYEELDEKFCNKDQEI